MKGIPYWGKETHKDIENLNDLPLEKLSLSEFYARYKEVLIKADLFSDFNHKNINSPSNLSLYHFTLAVGLLNLVYVIQDRDNPQMYYTSWGKDVRFNYRDRYAFIPYYTYNEIYIETQRKLEDSPYLNIDNETKELKLKYDFSLEKFIIHDRLEDFSVKSLTVYDIKKHALIEVDIDTIPLLPNEIKEFSLVDLNKRYQNSAFIYYSYFEAEKHEAKKKDVELEEQGVKGYSYILVKDSPISKESRIRKEQDVPTYKNDSYKPIAFQDMRGYKFNEMYSDFDIFSFTEQEDALFSSPFWYRRHIFEAYLYCIFAQNLKPIEVEYQEQFNQLGVTETSVTFNLARKPLVLKHYYTDKDKDPSIIRPRNKFRRKTFEHYSTSREGFTYESHSVHWQ